MHHAEPPAPLQFYDAVRIRGATITASILYGANLSEADLQGVAIGDSRLLAADLRGANLQGGLLWFTRIYRSDLTNANFRGAILKLSEFGRTALGNVDFRDTELTCIDFRGASLSTDSMRGKKYANFERAFLKGVAVRNVNPQRVNFAAARVLSLDLQSEVRNYSEDLGCGYYPDWFEFDRILEMEDIPTPLGLKVDQNVQSDQDTSKLEELWDNIRLSSLTAEKYEQVLVEGLRETGCNVDGAPYVIRGILDFLALRFSHLSSNVGALASAFLDDFQCIGAHGLTETERFYLKRMRDLREFPPLRHREWFDF